MHPDCTGRHALEESPMTSSCARRALALVVLASLTACGGGGAPSNGGITGSGPPNDNQGGGGVTEGDADKLVKTYATTGLDGSFAEVDLVDGGNPDSTAPADVSKQQFLAKLMSLKGVDVNGDGFPDQYGTGKDPGTNAAWILGANNLYDLFQTT